ncbi:glycosyltransferase [Subtercola sp. Z020]|nr:glycosyltransferase [Subtercola sp. Z020]
MGTGAARAAGAASSAGATSPAPTAGAVVGAASGAGAAGARLRLAAGRNAGAAAAQGAGARLLVFLDADCLPGPELLERYAEAAAEHPESVLCGPVTYLPEGARPRTAREFAVATAPHAARPNLPAGETRAAHDDEYRLFWSLSFACADATWRTSGGFAELYEGYGAEDTDFASTLRERRIDLRWVGGAHAYHQYHPTSSPPWQHLDDILRNGALYNARWGSWPMQGWLAAFEEAGAIERVGGGWRRVLDAAGHPVDAARRGTAERDSTKLDTA